jgi:TrmH RNA methyltransferase
VKRPPAPRGTPSKPAAPSELVYGLRAVDAALAMRPTAAIELSFDSHAEREIAPILERAERLGIAVVPSSEQELRSKTRTHNHEGVVLATQPRRWTPPKELAALLADGRGAAVALDRVRNAYNIGAILRSAAFFGLDAALFGSRAPDPDLPEDAVRVAEGGAEHLALSRTTDLADTLSRLRASGVQVVAAESDGAESAVGFTFAPRAVLVLGHEREGISDRVRAQCDAVVAIRGTGAIESLNVAIAASLMISELVRGRPALSRPRSIARPPSPGPTAPPTKQPHARPHRR